MGLLDQRLQLLASVERDHAARGDGDFLAGLGVAAGALWFVAQLKVTEPGQLHALPILERQADLLEERLHHVLRLALVQPHLFKKHVRQLGFCKCHLRSLGKAESLSTSLLKYVRSEEHTSELQSLTNLVCRLL